MEVGIRTAKPDDHNWIVEIVDLWWGREVANAVPKLFLDHFWTTSFVAQVNEENIGFLIGFLSASESDQAYIHFVGVDPTQRKLGTAKRLYEAFFNVAKQNDRTTINAITTPLNKGSIEFHRKMGFTVSEPIDGYNRPGTAHILFSYQF